MDVKKELKKFFGPKSLPANAKIGSLVNKLHKEIDALCREICLSLKDPNDIKAIEEHLEQIKSSIDNLARAYS